MLDRSKHCPCYFHVALIFCTPFLIYDSSAILIVQHFVSFLFCIGDHCNRCYGQFEFIASLNCFMSVRMNQLSLGFCTVLFVPLLVFFIVSALLLLHCTTACAGISFKRRQSVASNNVDVIFRQSEGGASLGPSAGIEPDMQIFYVFRPIRTVSLEPDSRRHVATGVPGWCRGTSGFR